MVITTSCMIFFFLHTKPASLAFHSVEEMKKMFEGIKRQGEELCGRWRRRAHKCFGQWQNKCSHKKEAHLMRFCHSFSFFFHSMSCQTLVYYSGQQMNCLCGTSETKREINPLGRWEEFIFLVFFQIDC